MEPGDLGWDSSEEEVESDARLADLSTLTGLDRWEIGRRARRALDVIATVDQEEARRELRLLRVTARVSLLGEFRRRERRRWPISLRRPGPGALRLCPGCGEEGSPDSLSGACPECSLLGVTRELSQQELTQMERDQGGGAGETDEDEPLTQWAERRRRRGGPPGPWGWCPS